MRKGKGKGKGKDNGDVLRRTLPFPVSNIISVGPTPHQLSLDGAVSQRTTFCEYSACSGANAVRWSGGVIIHRGPSPELSRLGADVAKWSDFSVANEMTGADLTESKSTLSKFTTLPSGGRANVEYFKIRAFLLEKEYSASRDSYSNVMSQKRGELYIPHCHYLSGHMALSRNVVRKLSLKKERNGYF